MTQKVIEGLCRRDRLASTRITAEGSSDEGSPGSQVGKKRSEHESRISDQGLRINRNKKRENAK